MKTVDREGNSAYTHHRHRHHHPPTVGVQACTTPQEILSRAKRPLVCGLCGVTRGRKGRLCSGQQLPKDNSDRFNLRNSIAETPHPSHLVSVHGLSVVGPQHALSTRLAPYHQNRTS
jgi:hypothetical protein